MVLSGVRVIPGVQEGSLSGQATGRQSESPGRFTGSGRGVCLRATGRIHKEFLGLVPYWEMGKKHRFYSSL